MSEDELASTLDDSRRREKKPPGEVLFADELVDLGFLARGGMGEVRRVRDTRLNRVLAVKVLHHELVDDERAHARFLAEAQATSQLQHPGIVAVHSRGELDDGRPWFTMTEIRGRTLAQVLREARAGAADAWNLREQVEALRRACQAVAHAHDNGVVHRDLKPANIMVGAFGEVLVLDWGLARLVAGESAPRERLVETGDAPVTRAGQVMGTPTHMAPEQAMGGTVGPSADVHALGAILHEMLTGELPYGRDADEAWRRVRRGPRPSPIHRTPTGRPAPPLELVETCERALERDPARRPADATELSREITAWLDGARKREQALELVEEADARRPLLDDRARRVAQLREEARELL
ncbi:MAG: serine/threonine-protein kinase, partial [Acidobacteriota bacterium]